MSEPTYTAQEIQDAFTKAFPNTRGNQLPDLIAELQRPAYVPEVGTLYMWRTAGKENWSCGDIWQGKFSPVSRREYRPLTRWECGPVGRALGVAVDALERVNNGIVNQHRIDETLSEIKRLEQSDE